MTMRVLSFDGGGIRGVLSAEIYRRLATSREAPLGDPLMLCGTSTGGIIALGLSAGLSPIDVVDLYKNKGQDIFSSRGFWDRVTPDELWRANYSNKGLENALRDVFGEKRLGDLDTWVLIPAFDLDNWTPYFHDSSREDHKDLLVVDVALRTSAAPTYFPSHQGFADGGVCANNPSDCAVACLLHNGYTPDCISLLSIGTGHNPRSFKGGDLGLSQWAKSIVTMMIEGPTASSVYRTRRTLGETFHRIDPELARIIDLDDVASIDELLAIAGAFDLNDTLSWLEKYWD